MKITKEKFTSIYSEDISKKKYDEIIGQIEDRVWEVWKGICKIQDKKLVWYDFDNETGEEEKSSGYFDPEKYKKIIGITGEWPYMDDDAPYDNYIPVEFLWEDYEDKVIAEMEKFKRDKEQKRIDNHNKREERKKLRKVMIESIRSKLTKEELRFVRFAKQ